MKIRKLCLIICLLSAVILLTISASADMGPKASVRISFENIGDDVCYGTLLSKNPSTGPQSVWDGNENHIYNYDLDIEIWRAFAEYQDSDGFHFLQLAWNINETNEIAWTYYPPDTFKILLYFPEKDAFIVSDIYERYAFDTYYTVDMSSFDVNQSDNVNTVTALKSYEWQNETISLLARIVLTIIVEMVVAILFGFKEKKPLILLTVANVSTQIFLNVFINIVNFRSGQWAFMEWFIILEIAIFAIEAIIYSSLINRISQKQRSKVFYVIYSLIANSASFATGLFLAEIIPGIF